MRRYDTILFDLDGTLTDSKPGITRCVQHALARMGVVADDLDQLDVFIGPPLLDSFQKYFDLDEARARCCIEFYRERFVTTGIYENSVYPEIPEMLAALREAGARLIVATSKPHLYAREILRYFALDGYFSGVVGATMDGTMIRKEEIIAHVFQSYPELAKAQSVMVGDHDLDIAGARLNGIDSIAVLWGFGRAAEIEAAGPTYVANSPAKLAGLILGVAAEG